MSLNKITNCVSVFSYINGYAVYLLHKIDIIILLFAWPGIAKSSNNITNSVIFIASFITRT